MDGEDSLLKEENCVASRKTCAVFNKKGEGGDARVVEEVLVFGVPPTGLSVQVTCQANSAFVNSGKPLFTYSVFAVTNVSKMIALWQAYLARLSRFNPTSPTLFVFLC